MQEKNVSLRLSRRQAIASVGALLVGPSAQAAAPTRTAAGVTPRNLRCEYRTDPQGVDSVRPRLSWTMEGSTRGLHQTAYQIRVSSSPEAFVQGKGDLWDSGRVTSDRCASIIYGGRPLTSRTRCHWQVRVWDQDGHVTDWSQPALWTMGLLRPSDWQAQWITDPVLADPANRPRTPVHCYRSEIAHTPDAVKWIVLDLGSAKRFDGTRLQPAKPDGVSGDIRTVMYPLRFKIEVADRADFQDARTVVDKTDRDVRTPRPGFFDAERYHFPETTARYVRLTVTRLSCWDGTDYALALGKFQIFVGDAEIASGADVKASDSLETADWSSRFLTDPQAHVAYTPTPSALLPHLDGVDSTSRVTSRVPMLRRAFSVRGAVRSATFYCAARGFYEARINGAPVSPDLLAGGYTEYDRRIEYQAYDVTKALHEGENALGAMVGYGWYAGHMNLGGNGFMFGYFPQFLAQLEIEYADGRRDVISSDSGWKSTLDGPIRWSDLLDGEGYDCRREMPGWDKPHFDVVDWAGVAVIPRDRTPLVWQRPAPVRRIQELRPVAVKEIAPGVFVYDMGQEISGWCRVKADGPDGTRVTLRHAELRHADGSINRENLWDTAAEENYVLDGRGTRMLEPHFTYHGFRFVEVSGLPAASADAIVGVHVRTSARRVSQFRCSNPLFNKLMEASLWTQQNMLFDVPAGCAGRSERLAWTGDIRPCVQTALYHFDSVAFFEKYAADLRADQTDEGRFTDICPHAHLRDTDICVGSPGWADAGVSMPWDLYLHTGDPRILADQYAAAKRWVDYIHANNPDLIWRNARGMAWGDWLSGGTATPADIGSTAFFAHDADLVAHMASVLGYRDDAAKYRVLFEQIRAAFARHFVTSAGIISTAGTGSLDVTDRVRALVQGSNLTLTVKNDTFGGDPALGVVKHFELTYRIGDREETRSYAEDVVVHVAGGDAGLKIVKAVYGVRAADAPKDAQGSYALALHFGLLDEPLRSRAVARLAEVIRRDGGHPATGFWSSVEILLALSDNGLHDVAAQMMNLTTAPSWGHMVQGDGTTMWESFDADTRNLSLNHWTHSAIGEWLWRHIAGIAPDPAEPGYRSVIIRPRPSAEVDSCASSFESQRGTVAVKWSRQGTAFTMDLTVPANMSATVYLPAAAGAKVTEGRRPIGTAISVRPVPTAGAGVYQVTSGTYRFVVA